jgi:hypothetical protein
MQAVMPVPIDQEVGLVKLQKPAPFIESISTPPYQFLTALSTFI